jgi:DNA processing protein
MVPAALDDDELGAWLHLLHSPGVGREAARRLLARFLSPKAAITAPIEQLRECVDATTALALGTSPDGHAQRLHATLSWLSAESNRHVLVLGDAAYPAPLLHNPDPPLLLYLQGDASLLNSPCLAIVGSRQPTAQGRSHAQRFARTLAERGWTIVSGLAAGIDGAAHEGALDAGGRTIAVVGTGLDRVYPPRHRDLAHRIAQTGLLVSELCLGTPPLPANFPQRNRIIAGLSRGTLVVEAALRSGSLITARLASEAGREVMAIPGSILAPQSAGCHALIRQGAALVDTPELVADELGPLDGPRLQPAAAPATVSASGDLPDDPILAVLGHDPQSLDTLIDRCGWPAPQLSAHLLTLELDGHVARLPGGLYQRLQGA